MMKVLSTTTLSALLLFLTAQTAHAKDSDTAADDVTGFQEFVARNKTRTYSSDAHSCPFNNQIRGVNLEKKVNDAAKNLIFASANFIRTFPDFVRSKLANLCREASDDRPNHFEIEQIERLAEKIPRRMWNDDDELIQTWFKEGLPLVDAHPNAWRADRDKLLLVAERGASYEWKSRAFDYAAEELRNDVEFITQVMEFEPSFFQFASETLQTENYKLAVWALGERRFVDLCRDGLVSRPQFSFGAPRIILSATKLEEFRARATDELALHNTFVNPFLCGVCSLNRSNVHCQLWILNQERDLVELIGDFVGIPRGNHLHNIRKALDNLSASDGSGDE